MPLSVGDKLGHYEVLAPIGAGGMGEVYRAHDTQLERDVAIKILPRALANDPERLTRFDREAKILAALNHPNIAVIYGLAESEGQRALAMELVPGETLADRVRSSKGCGPMPLEEILPIMRQIAEALEAAHEKGVVHRDLKPANVMITPAGLVKVLDFGLAAMAQPGPSASGDPSNSPTLTMGMTQAGVIMGTAAYMSPEQAAGMAVDKRADIWSYGVVLFEMLSGARLFGGDTVAHTLADVLRAPIEFNRVSAPAPLKNLLRRCLDRNVSTRLRDIGEARVAIQSYLADPVGQGQALPTTRSTAPRHHGIWMSWTTAAVATLAFAAVSAIHFREQPPERQVLQYTLAPPERVSSISNMAISPNGHYVVISATGEGGPRLWVRSLDSLQTQLLPGTENASHPFWSPDGRYIAFFAQDKLMKISVNGGPTQALCAAPNSRGGSWGRDNIIVFSPTNGSSGLSRVSAGGGVPVPLTKIDGTGRWPLFLPDGRRFLYLAGNERGNGNGGKDKGIRLASLDSADERRLAQEESKPDYLPPSPVNPLGYLLFVRQDTLMAQPVDPQNLEPKGDLFPVAERISRGPYYGNFLFSAAASGLLIFQSGGSSGGNQHVWFDRAGKEIGTVGGTVPSRNSIALSPEGKRVVIERIADQNNSDLWITDMEQSGTETRLTFDPSPNGQPVWSPDGSKIAFTRIQGGTANLYQRASNGTGQDQLVFESKETKVVEDWSRDGKFLIFANRGGQTGYDLWALPMTGAGASKPTEGKTGERKPILLLQTQYLALQGQLSPDSRWLAYTSTESGRAQVYVQPFAPGWDKPIKGKWQISTGPGAEPRWRGDGKELFYMTSDRKLMAVEIKAGEQTFDRGTPQALFDTHSSVVLNGSGNFSYAVSADGKRFLMPVAADTQGETPPLTVVVNWLAWVKK